MGCARPWEWNFRGGSKFSFRNSISDSVGGYRTKGKSSTNPEKLAHFTGLFWFFFPANLYFPVISPPPPLQPPIGSCLPVILSIIICADYIYQINEIPSECLVFTSEPLSVLTQCSTHKFNVILEISTLGLVAHMIQEETVTPGSINDRQMISDIRLLNGINPVASCHLFILVCVILFLKSHTLALVFLVKSYFCSFLVPCMNCCD
ncbi:hypothetical protein VP01_1705g1 [Puccinia sorghi]|uniref:Uncharacterized protein n=1 Tax=Puccinia sorghi TaxID=27349 RepID=A0A0L6VHG3_9BASI|nr:hypothetical protein VP01_1705g1 [Puccinia sorghi]